MLLRRRTGRLRIARQYGIDNRPVLIQQAGTGSLRTVLYGPSLKNGTLHQLVDQGHDVHQQGVVGGTTAVCRATSSFSSRSRSQASCAASMPCMMR